MPIGAIIGVLMAVVFIGGMAWLVVYSIRQGKKTMALSGDVNAELAKLFGPPGKYGVYSSRPIQLGPYAATAVLQPGSKNSPPTLRLQMPIEVRTAGAKVEHGAYRDTARARIGGKLPVLFRKERSNDRFGKRIGLNVEHDTGDAAFDDEVYIESDAKREDLDALLSDTTTRQAVHQILGAGFSNVELFRGESALKAAAVRPTADTVAKTMEVLQKLALIAENLPAFDASPVGRAAPLTTSLAASIGMLGGFCAFVFGVLTATKFPIVVPGAVLNCVLLGFGVWVLVNILSFLLIRGRSDALRAYAFIFFSGVFAWPALVVGVAAGVNGAFDPGVATPHDAKVTRRWITTSKNNKTYHLEVQSWRPDTKGIEITVSSTLYGATYDGAPVRVITKPGRLGWEWIDGIQQVTQQPPPPVWR